MRCRGAAWCGGVSVLAARYALKRTRRQLRAETAHLARVGRAAYPVLIMNPKSGGGKAEQFHLADECRKRGIEPVVLKPGDDLLQLAEDAIAGGADVIGMAGGDGSQALVASVAARHGVPHVCVPAGTRNHFALDLGLDRSDVVGALDAFTDGVERRIDLAVVNGRTFVNNASLGLYAEIVQSPITGTRRSRPPPRSCLTCSARTRPRSTCATPGRTARRTPRHNWSSCRTTRTSSTTQAAREPVRGSTKACSGS